MAQKKNHTNGGRICKQYTVKNYLRNGKNRDKYIHRFYGAHNFGNRWPPTSVGTIFTRPNSSIVGLTYPQTYNGINKKNINCILNRHFTAMVSKKYFVKNSFHSTKTVFTPKNKFGWHTKKTRILCARRV